MTPKNGNKTDMLRQNLPNLVPKISKMDREYYVVCWLCGKEQRVKEGVKELENLNWAEMTVRKRDYKETGWICGKCFYEISEV